MNRFLLALLSAFLIVGSCSAFAPTKPHSPTVRRSNLETRHNSLVDTVSSMYKNWGKKATASHILFRPSQFAEADAKVKLSEIKAEVGNDPEKFAAAAREWSGCPSSKSGGDLGEFGPGMMVKNFDDVCFNEEVGVVHGPVSTQFGEHLILITKRT
jgi:peptidyl-prolyl cis-trans isomerase C